MKKYAASFALCSLAFAAHASADPATTDVASRAVPEAALAAPQSSQSSTADATERLLTLADLDHDGTLSVEELESTVLRQVEKRVRTRHAQLDRNHDGLVTRSEVPKMDAARFARFDSDRNGGFTVDELSRLMVAEVRARMLGVFAKLDSDGNTRCTLAELRATRNARVAKTDSVKPAQRSTEARRTGKGAPTSF